MERTLSSLEETLAFGEKLGTVLQAGDVVALVGALGAGKTTLVKGIAKGMGISQEYSVTSPTFVFAHIYHGKLPLYHLDLYRVEHKNELPSIGIEDMLGGPGVAVVEWFDRFPQIWPEDHLRVEMKLKDENSREVFLSHAGSRSKQVILELGKGL